jgi:protein disulfide-isomerase A1
VIGTSAILLEGRIIKNCSCFCLLSLVVQFDETDVVVLGGGNFTEFVNSNHYVLVEFYAPWCGYCKQLAPEYAEAATALKGSAALAKVDATAHDELAREYFVDSYPTLWFFIDGVGKEYGGHNKRSAPYF